MEVVIIHACIAVDHQTLNVHTATHQISDTWKLQMNACVCKDISNQGAYARCQAIIPHALLQDTIRIHSMVNVNKSVGILL